MKTPTIRVKRGTLAKYADELEYIAKHLDSIAYAHPLPGGNSIAGALNRMAIQLRIAEQSDGRKSI